MGKGRRTTLSKLPCISDEQELSLTVGLFAFLYLIVSVLLYVGLFVCQPLYISLCRSASLSVYLSALLYHSLSLCQNFSISLCLFDFQYVCLSVCLDICLSVCHSISLSVRLSVCLSLCLSDFLYLSLSV